MYVGFRVNPDPNPQAPAYCATATTAAAVAAEAVLVVVVAVIANFRESVRVSSLLGGKAAPVVAARLGFGWRGPRGQI